jgi:heptaprenyl diphosphate synthase
MWTLLQNEKSFSRDVALTGLLAAFSIILSYIEYLLPINIVIPGIKPGIANVAIVVALYILDYKKAIIIDVIKLIVIGILFGNAFSIMFSVAGALLSLLVMIVVKKIKIFTILAVSVCGGVFHNVGQLIVAIFIMKSTIIVSYLPFLIIGGVLAGIIVGIISAAVTRIMMKANKITD